MPMGVIYKGALPFVLSTVLAIVITFMFPALATWLPGLGK
jgi:TRAP-type mannitol/chloroaromatic compound transport system permease large subunit